MRESQATPEPGDDEEGEGFETPDIETILAENQTADEL